MYAIRDIETRRIDQWGTEIEDMAVFDTMVEATAFFQEYTDPENWEIVPITYQEALNQIEEVFW